MTRSWWAEPCWAVEVNRRSSFQVAASRSTGCGAAVGILPNGLWSLVIVEVQMHR